MNENRFDKPIHKPFSLFAYPAEDNFAGVKYPLSWIKKVQEGYFHNVINPLLIMIIRVNDG